jgi:parvulin-like peptidyl-prolyl isomerase
MLQQARLLASMYEEESLAKSVKATQAEIDEYLKTHPEEQVHARHILISIKSPDAPSEGGLDKAQARAKAEEVLKRVKAGENFESLAKEYSTDPGSKESGGDLGWFGRGRMVPEFEKAAFALQTGQTSEIVESPFGFHIIKVEGRRNGDPQQAAQEAEQEKEKKLIEEIVKRQSGHITIADNFAVQAPPPPQMQQGLPFAPEAPPATSSPAPRGKSSPKKR